MYVITKTNEREIIMDEFEELKRKLMNKVNNKEMPKEVIQIINDIYKKMMQITQRTGISNRKVEEVISENNRLLNRKVNNNIANARKESQLEEMNYILNGMQRNLEEIEESQLNEEQREEENNKSRQRNISTFEEMDMNSSKDVDGIVNLLDENVREVRSVIRRVLASRGVSEDKLDQVRNEFSRVIHYIQSKVPGELMRILREEDKRTIDEIITDYEEYEEFRAQKKNKTKHEQFADSLDAGISLEEQHEFSNEFCNRATREEFAGKEETSNSLEVLFK